MSGLTPEQLPEYCDRLEKECEKAKEKKVIKAVFKLKNITELYDWRNVRPNLNSDFVDTQLVEIVPSDFVPVTSQETQLVEDLLAVFLGGNSGYIQAEPLPDKHAVRTFNISKDLDVNLYEFSGKCLVLATYYSQLCRFIDDNRMLNVGRVNQALSSAIDSIVTDYRGFIVDLEKIHRDRCLSLTELWFQIQDVLRTLEIINTVATDVTKDELRGAATLTYLHNYHSYLIEPPSHRKLMKFLTKRAATPFMKSLEEWIFHGKIFDPFDEFMITERPRGSFKDFNSPEYWEKRYQIHKFRIPIFLERMQTEILKSGAYLNVIRESFKKCVRNLNFAEVEEIKYSWKSYKYFDVIHRAYVHYSSYLLSHMMEEYQLMDRFTFMKRYFLVQQGDFVIQVLDTCEEELSKPIADVLPSRLATLVDMAIRNVENELRDDVEIVLEHQDLSYQLSKILTLGSPEEIGKRVGINPNLTGFESFTLGMKCRWPISLIFNARIISSYQMLFRLLFYCKHIERLLSRVWLLDQRLRRLPSGHMRQYSSAFGLRHKMIYFIQSMQYYMMEEAIEPNWIDFKQKLEELTQVELASSIFEERDFVKVPSVDDLMNIHKNFLDKCLNDCLLTNSTLYPIFKELLSICKEFANFIIAQAAVTTGDAIVRDFATFSTVIESMDVDFQKKYVLLLKTIAKLAPTDDGATKIFEILNRANFNNYFSTRTDAPEELHASQSTQ